MGKHPYANKKEKYYPIFPAIEYLQKHPSSSVSVKALADMCNISDAHLRRLFKDYTGKTIVSYKTDTKLEISKKMLENSNLTIEKIADLLEFESSSYFCKLFKKKTGITPSEYRRLN